MVRVVLVYSIRALKATNRMMLIMSESTVVRYRLAVALEGFERQLALEPEHTPDQRVGAQGCRGVPSWI